MAVLPSNTFLVPIALEEYIFQLATIHAVKLSIANPADEAIIMSNAHKNMQIFIIQRNSNTTKYMNAQRAPSSFLTQDVKHVPKAIYK